MNRSTVAFALLALAACSNGSPLPVDQDADDVPALSGFRFPGVKDDVASLGDSGSEKEGDAAVGGGLAMAGSSGEETGMDGADGSVGADSGSADGGTLDGSVGVVDDPADSHALFVGTWTLYRPTNPTPNCADPEGDSYSFCNDGPASSCATVIFDTNYTATYVLVSSSTPWLFDHWEGNVWVGQPRIISLVDNFNSQPRAWLVDDNTMYITTTYINTSNVKTVDDFCSNSKLIRL